MTDHLAVELTVLSWPFRTGTVVVEPTTAQVVCEWDLDELAGEPDLVFVAPLIDPRLPYVGRAQGIIKFLEEEQTMLKDSVAPALDDAHITPFLSPTVVESLEEFAAKHDLPGVGAFSLKSMNTLMSVLGERTQDEHHAFLVDYYEKFVAPGVAGSSYVRERKDLFAASCPNEAMAKAIWQSECEATSIGEFSLWTALRCHFGWRIEFSEEPRPKFQIAVQLAERFPRRSAAE